MADHISEEEQLDALKRWWSENGKSLVIGIVVAVGVYFGWQGWQSQQAAARESASLLFEDLLEVAIVTPGQEISEDDKLRVIDLADQLKTDAGDTLYAGNAAFFLAKLYVQDGELDKAAAELAWVREQNISEGSSLIATLRLAQVKYAQEDYSAALELLNSGDAKSFAPAYAELKGDVLMAQQDYAGARSAYQTALDGLTPAMSQRGEIIEMKMNSIPSTTAAAAATKAES